MSNKTSIISIKKSNDINQIYNKINSKQGSKILVTNKLEENEDLDLDLSLDANANSESDSESDEDNLIKLEKGYNLGYPKNYGSKWSDNEIQKVLNMLKKSGVKDLVDSYESNMVIKKIANKLNRSIGGVYILIKKTIFEKYLNGQDSESIGYELNLSCKDVKSIVKLYLDKDSDKIINLLEKENKLLRLKIDNIKLKKELIEISKY